jgi:hypothetical protein
MKKGLEALEALELNDFSGYEISKHRSDIVDEALAELRQAIAEAEKAATLQEVSDIGQEIEKEPVSAKAIFETIIQWDEGAGKRSRIDLAQRIFDLYAPPKREWVGLTDEEIHKIIDDCTPDEAEPEELNDFAKAIFAVEAKLRERNT